VQDSIIGHLSKGYRQRVGIAQALIHQPQVLILDEPTIGLDPEQVVEIRKLIRDLGTTQTVILSTHILSEVSSVCDRVIVIDKGRILASQSLTELRAQLQHTRTVRIEVEGPEAQVRGALERLSGVESVKRVGMDGANGGEPATLSLWLSIKATISANKRAERIMETDGAYWKYVPQSPHWKICTCNSFVILEHALNNATNWMVELTTEG
jgi:ABC-type multidrug transport system ATPase subunit